MATSNALVSCVIGLDERFQPLMISTSTCVFLFAKANLYCCTNFLTMKHIDAPKSRSAYSSIVMSLLHLIMITIEKMVLDPKIA